MLEVYFTFDFSLLLRNTHSAGECLSIDHENQLIILSFAVFNQECEQDFKYLNKHCTLSLPEGSILHIMICIVNASFCDQTGMRLRKRFTQNTNRHP